MKIDGAGDGARTRDVQLGKLVFSEGQRYPVADVGILGDNSP